MAGKRKFKVEEVIAALRECKGMVYMAAELLGCEPKTIYNYRDKYASVSDELAKQDGLVNDTAELKLVQAIHGGEPWAIKYRLSTKAKDRGYVEKQEVEHSGSIDVRGLTDEELEAIVNGKG